MFLLKICLSELNNSVRTVNQGVDAGPCPGNIRDLEYGDDEILLSSTAEDSGRRVTFV